MNGYCELKLVKILFVRASNSSFVLRDLEILCKNFDVKEIKVPEFNVPNGAFLSKIFSRLSIAFYFLKLSNEIMRVDVIYSWWATTCSFYLVLLCKILHRKSIVVVGGFEVAYVPEINYGALLSPLRRIRTRFLLKNASKVLVVSKSSREQAQRFLRTQKIRLVYNGVDVERFKPRFDKINKVITVGSVSDMTIKRKGLKTFVEASRFLPNIPFLVIGKFDRSVDTLREIAGPNVTFTGYVSDEELLKNYQTSKVYCQLSAHESFGVSIAEAMACGCVPVVTRKYAIPEVVGDTGYYAKYDDPKSAGEAIKKALLSDKGEKARKRIVNLYSLTKREKSLVHEISEMIE